jgi:hypothetical protein
MDPEHVESLLVGYTPPIPSAKVKAAVLQEARRRINRSTDRFSWGTKAIPSAAVVLYLLGTLLLLLSPFGKPAPETPGSLPPQEPQLLSDRIQAFAKGDDSVRPAILKAGPRAILLLRDVRDEAPVRVDPLIFEIKKAAAGPSESRTADSLEAKGTLRLETGADPDAKYPFYAVYDQIAHQVPLICDPVLLQAGSKTEHLVPLRDNQGRLRDLLDSSCRETGLDWGYFFGRTLVSTPERLWPERPPAPAPPLAREDAVRARRWVEALKSDALEERSEATKALKALGRGALPILREGLHQKDPEVVARLKDLLSFLDPPLKTGIFHIPGADRQKLEGADAKFRESLKGLTSSFLASSLGFNDFLQLLLGPRQIKFTTSMAARAPRASVQMHNVELWAILCVASQANGCDFLIQSGELWFGTQAEVEQELGRGKK